MRIKSLERCELNKVKTKIVEISIEVVIIFNINKNNLIVVLEKIVQWFIRIVALFQYENTLFQYYDEKLCKYTIFFEL